MDWLEVSVVTDGEGAEAVAEVLRPFAYQEGVVLEQLGDMKDLDPTAMEPAVTVKIYLSEADDTPDKRRRLEEIIYHMGRLYPLPPPTFRKLKEEDWEHAWKAHYHPFRIGRKMWIQPSWLDSEEQAAQPVAEGDIVLVLDPGMAFGTGLHPTTQMCLRGLEQVVQTGDDVLDVGTGSGILAIAAAKLGAPRVVGVDTDLLAVETAVSNAQQNGVEAQLELWQGTLSDVTEKGWDIVVVNILAPIIIGMLNENGLMSYLGGNGRLLLSGIIDQQVADVKAAIEAAGGELVQETAVRDWVNLIVKRAGDK